MKSTVEALKDLFVKLGGHADDVTDDVTIPDCVDAITDIMNPSGSRLVVHSDDNGTVMIEMR